MKKLVIFDMDGTTLDTIYDIADSINSALVKLGHKERNIDEIRAFIGNGGRTFVKRCMPENSTEEQIDEARAVYSAEYKRINGGKIKTGIYDGLDGVFKTLKSRGYELSVLTNKTEDVAVALFDRLLSPYGFAAVMGNSGKFPLKPDAASTEYLIKSLNADKENTFFVGDGETDALTAKNAGLKFIGCLWGYRSKMELEKAGAEVFARQPQDLIQLIR